MPKAQNINLAEAIQAARSRSELSLTEMARRANYSLQHLSRVENGHVDVTAELMVKVAKVLKAPGLVVAYWEVRAKTLTAELKKARESLKEARARAAAAR
jgi:transcriptional regulator with XRE-family HTH domain